MFCEHSKSGLCSKCTELKPYYQFRVCKKQCFVCNECGYFWGPGAPADLQNKPIVWTPEMKQYTSDGVKESLKLKWDTYYAKLTAHQSPTWVCDQRTKDYFCLSQWLIDELTFLNCPDEDRKDVQSFFNRKARATEDLYQLATDSINSFLTGKIDRYRRGR